jgi:hypothetical protein
MRIERLDEQGDDRLLVMGKHFVAPTNTAEANNQETQWNCGTRDDCRYDHATRPEKRNNQCDDRNAKCTDNDRACGFIDSRSMECGGTGSICRASFKEIEGMLIDVPYKCASLGQHWQE